MYDIYYAHHRWKYYTDIEQYELDLIRRYFPRATIFDPSIDLKASRSDNEEIIMAECLETVRNSDILIFSSVNGCVGTGVYHEVKEAQKKGKLIFYIYQNKLTPDFDIYERDEFDRTDRIYANVCPLY